MIVDKKIADEQKHRRHRRSHSSSSSSESSDSDAAPPKFSAKHAFRASTRRHQRSHSSSSSESSNSDAAPPDYSAAEHAIGASTSGGDSPVNGLTVATRRDSINGTWMLDPFAPASTTSLLTSVVSAINGRGGRRRRQRDIASTLSSPAATFSTRHGSITARLAIVGDALSPARAGVKATTRDRKIDIDLFAKAPSKFIDLDVYSRKGRVLVMIPRTYSGIVDLSSRRGDVTVLPVLSAAARVVRAAGREVSILVGDDGQAAGSSSQFADHMHLYSRRGSVTVGFSGEDHYVQPEGKFAKMKRGGSQKD
ncbi:hypothetical protein FA95DRAFT_1606456 [Auriscalpium vulgare]|uniref:Uncharacterized protein n=1 Tax=Auriscalpium vulgare TaxID=40419 RepID=A0ACB8RS42_9AGAM|nr:hypothetical protein FA95DRAFT_1606456 [Auriscalpium vulgare]